MVSEIIFSKLDPLCGPVAAKPLVLELLCLEVGTSEKKSRGGAVL